jgi:outer membrane immunogenic protein
MKKLLIASAIAATFVTPQAFAQAKNFEGFGVSANLNLASTTTEVTSTTFNGSSTESATNLGIQGQYNFAFGDSFVLGLGLSVGLGDVKAGVLTSGGTTVTVIQKASSSVFIAPGFAVSPSTLIYGKIASLSGKLEAVGNSTVTTSMSGMGYGMGFQTYMNKNMYIQGEFMQNNYEDRVFTAETDKNKASVFSIGVGYKF